MEQQLTSKQTMIHKAQVLDSYRRVMSGINGVARAVNGGKTEDEISDELNNLKFQIEIASKIFNEKKYKSECQDTVDKLKAEYFKEIKNLPTVSKELNTCIDIFGYAFEGPLDLELMPVEGSTTLTPDQQKVCLGALNYAGCINDQIKEKAKDAQNEEDLTIFKKVSKYPGADSSYVQDYDMIDEHKKVFQKYGNQ